MSSLGSVIALSWLNMFCTANPHLSHEEFPPSDCQCILDGLPLPKPGDILQITFPREPTQDEVA